MIRSLQLSLIAAGVFFLSAEYEKNLPVNDYSVRLSRQIFIPGSIRNNLQTGDIILRNGKNFISDVFREFSLQDKKYSHAGIISIEQDKIFVYHVLGNETKKGNELKKELLETFVNSEENNAFGIYRYILSGDERKNVFDNLQTFTSKKIVFDSHFDLATDSEMYCTEFIYKVIKTATDNKEWLHFTILNGKKYIAPDNLYMNQDTKLIYSGSN